MTIVSDTYRFVVGVDTHAATHQFAVITATTGAVVDEAEFPTTTAGMARAAAWIGRRTGGEVEATLVSAEGTGSYGARLAVSLLEAGYRVVDASSPKRERGSGKSDRIDAVLAARGTLSKPVHKLADARAGQLHATLQVLVTARDAMCRERTRAINELNALLRTYDLGVDARRKATRATIRTVSCWRERNEPLATSTARAEAVRLAKRILDLDLDIEANLTRLRELVAQANQPLLDLPGVGPVNAAIVLTAWSHPGRVRNDAAFAKLAGACPVPAKSGTSVERGQKEYRLNRAGDRQLNRALHSIAQNRMIRDPRTHDYIARRTAQGLSKPRIRRCLKRYIARELHRTLTAMTP